MNNILRPSSSDPDNALKLDFDFRDCEQTGCNPCDIKGPKFDRFQKGGHCSVTIKRVK